MPAWFAGSLERWLSLENHRVSDSLSFTVQKQTYSGANVTGWRCCAKVRWERVIILGGRTSSHLFLNLVASSPRMRKTYPWNQFPRPLTESYDFFFKRRKLSEVLIARENVCQNDTVILWVKVDFAFYFDIETRPSQRVKKCVCCLEKDLKPIYMQSSHFAGGLFVCLFHIYLE